MIQFRIFSFFLIFCIVDNVVSIRTHTFLIFIIYNFLRIYILTYILFSLQV